MRSLPVTVSAFLILGACSAARGQFGQEASKGPRLGEPVTTYWKVGMVIRAQNGPCGGLYGTVSVPTDWPEQQVRISKEEFSNRVRVRYRVLEGGVKQMLVTVARLAHGETANALVTFEVVRRTLEAPEDPDVFTAPKKPPREVLKYLGPSPKIESRHAEIRSKVKELVDEEDSAWRQVESIYDWVRDHCQQRGSTVKGAVAAMRDGYGGYEDLTGLFIALCRARDIPARTVWVPDDCYAEFYLQDRDGHGYWIPCQVAGEREFGGVSCRQPILQKGDNVRTPEQREPQRYAAEFLKGKTGRGMRQPSVVFVRETAASD